jgi:hypothetical protein
MFLIKLLKIGRPLKRDFLFLDLNLLIQLPKLFDLGHIHLPLSERLPDFLDGAGQGLLESIEFIAGGRKSGHFWPEGGSAEGLAGLVGMVTVRGLEVDVGAVSDEMGVGPAADAEQAQAGYLSSHQPVPLGQIGLHAAVPAQDVEGGLQRHLEQHRVSQRLICEGAVLLHEELKLPDKPLLAVQLGHPEFLVRELVQDLVADRLAEHQAVLG